MGTLDGMLRYYEGALVGVSVAAYTSHVTYRSQAVDIQGSIVHMHHTMEQSLEF